MPAVYVGAAATTAAAAAASVAAAIPAPEADKTGAGDLLLMFAQSAGNATATYTATGWVSLSASVGAAVLYRWADGTEGATITVNRGTSTAGVMGVTVERRRDAGAVSVAAITQNTTGTSTTLVLTGVTTPVPNCDLIQMVHKNNTGAVTGWTPPATATERYDFEASGALNIRVAGGDEVVVAAGATGTRTWTRGATDTGISKGAVVALRPYVPSRNIRVSNPATVRSYVW